MLKIEIVSDFAWDIFTAEAISFLLEENSVIIRNSTRETTWMFEDIEMLSVDKETFIIDGAFIGLGPVESSSGPVDFTEEVLDVFEVDYGHGKILHFPLIEIDDGEQNR